MLGQTSVQNVILFVVLASGCCPVIDTLSIKDYAFLKAHEAGQSPSEYLYLGGLFGVHERGKTPDSCGAVRARGVHNLEAFLWAVRTYQTRYPNSLRGVKIGALGIDSCSDSFRLQQQVANFRQRLVSYGEPSIDPETLLGFVGPEVGEEAMDLSGYLRTSGPALVSYAATSSQLSDKDSYPYFLRTAPSDAVQNKAIVRILLKLNWKYVQLVYSDDAYGNTGRDRFTAAAGEAGICIVNTRKIAPSMSGDQMEAVVRSLEANRETRAVIVLAKADYARALLTAASERNVRGLFTWFGGTDWSNDPSIVKDVERQAEGAVSLSLQLSADSDDGLLQFSSYFAKMKPQTDEANPWFKEYWSDTFRCYFSGLPNPSGFSSLCDDISASLADADLDVYVPYTIRAVDAILGGIDKARRSSCQLLSDGLCDDLLDEGKWKRIFDSVIRYDGVFNQSTGDPVRAHYEIYNYRKDETPPCNGHCYIRIGDYSASTNVLNIDEARVHTYNVLGMRIYDAKSSCSQDPCTICGETPAPSITTTNPITGLASEDARRPVRLRTESWIIPLLTLVCIGIALVLILDIYLLSKIFRTPYMKHWRTMWLGQLLLIGILLCYLTLIAFVVTPTKATCAVIRLGVGVSYAMCFSVLLVKLMILISSESFGFLKGAFQVLMFLFAWGIQIVIDTEWLLLRYPAAVPTEDGSDVMRCRYGDFTSHVQSLVYVMLLILLCTGMAIRTSRISTNHREGVFIGLSTGFAIPIWLVWILVGMLYGDPSVQDPCLAFGLLVTATLMLFIMFLPKVRQLNSMGVEGIYAEDDTPEFAASVVQTIPASGQVGLAGYATTKPPSVIGYASSKTGEGSVILLPNGEMYAEPVTIRPVAKPDPNALYLRHPGSHVTASRGPQSIESLSVRSVPVGQNYSQKRYQGSQPASDTIRSTTRVLRVTNDLTGRKTPVLNRKTNSEGNPAGSRPASRNSDSKSDLGRQMPTITDLGSL